jgi:hypothetical protein
MNNNLRSFVLIILWIFTINHESYCQDEYDIFYLVIGSEHYEQDAKKFDEGFLGLNNLEAANNSAVKMEQLFEKMGAKSGRMLLSKSPYDINQKLILDQLNGLIKEVKKSKSKNPIIIVYYAGHGFSSGDYKTHFIPPGNFVKNPAMLEWEEWLEHSIAPLDLREILEESKISYMMLLDCCYEGELRQQELVSEEIHDLTGTEELMDLFGDIGNILDNLNTMTGPDPVIFSCKPGSTVITDLYDFGEGREEVAPLCRRIHLILDQKLKEEDVSISDLVIMLIYEDLDVRTGPAYSTWTFDEKNLNYLWKRK